MPLSTKATLIIPASNKVAVCTPACQSHAVNQASVGLSQQTINFFTQLFDTKDWPARWNCGTWSDFHGWLYIISDLIIWASYFAIPIILIRLLKKRSDIPFPKILWLFVGFIVLCGTTHLIDAIIFWWPAYRLSALIRFMTGIISVVTVFALIKVMPVVFSLRTVDDLEREIKERRLIEEKLAASEFLLKEAGRISRVGGWEIDMPTQKVTWSPMVYDIHEMPHDYIPTLEDGLNFYTEPCRQIVQKEVEGLYKDRGAFDLNLQIITARGRKIWIRTFGEAVHNHKGEIVKIRGIFADINDAKLKELALKEAIETQEKLNQALIAQIEHIREQDKTIEKIKEFKFLADSIPQMVWTTNSNGEVDYFNQHWYDYTGLNSEESLGWNWKTAIHPDDIDNAVKVWTESFTTGKPYEIEYRFKRKSDGEYKWHLGRALPMRNVKNRIIKWFGSCTDIDAYKRALDLENKINQFEDFNRIIAHNLRGPAASIEMLLTMIAQANSEKEREEWFDMLKHSSNALNETLNELMKVLEVRNNKSLPHDDCYLEDLVGKVEAMLKGQIISKNATIITSFDKPSVKFPKLYLESIIYNMVSNSLKYCKSDRAPQIKIASAIENEKVMLTFEDNGLGIDLKLHGKNMFKLNKIFHRGFESKGVGLFMTKIQVETFGGMISVDSEPDVGTKFTIAI